MYIAMNRFQVVKGQEEAFEEVWRARDSNLKEVPGFIEFQMLRGPEHEDHTLYASHTLFQDYQAFENWTKSEQFRKSHAGAGSYGHLYLGHPNFEGFQSVLELK